MEREDILEIAEGLRLIEEGVEKIQSVMKRKKMKSIKDIAEELLPIFKKDDFSLEDTIIDRLS